MTKKEEMGHILSAIKSVKFRARSAQISGEESNYRALMHDLMTLEVCMVNTVESFLAEDEFQEAA